MCETVSEVHSVNPARRERRLQPQTKSSEEEEITLEARIFASYILPTITTNSFTVIYRLNADIETLTCANKVKNGKL